jgi:hypothetical protein
MIMIPRKTNGDVTNILKKHHISENDNQKRLVKKLSGMEPWS